MPFPHALGYSPATTNLVKDINPVGNSDPGNLTAMNGLLFFTANDGLHGFELWKSDGTASGTVIVKDICPGTCSSSPHDLKVFNGELYFGANDGTHGDALWKTDGTSAGTMMVSAAGAYPTDLTVFRNLLYFNACDSTNGCELWSSNGTAAGTNLVKDICPGTCNSGVYDLTPVTGITIGSSFLYFTANDGTNGVELWKTDGTAVGTVMVKDICPGSCGSDPYDLTDVYLNAFSSTLFFGACYNMTFASCGLWRSGGTGASTYEVKSISSSIYGFGPGMLTSYNRELIFNANDDTHGRELWRSDGTASGTVLVKDINPGSGGSLGFDTATFFNGNLYFAANDGTHGYELWRTNGTDAGTTLVMDIAPGTNSSYPSALTVLSNTLFFSANDYVHGTELWMSDGTAAGTSMVKDINPGAYGSGPYELTPVGSKLFFSAFDGFQVSGGHGRELWVSLPDSTVSTPTLPASGILILGFLMILAARLVSRWKRAPRRPL